MADTYVEWKAWNREDFGHCGAEAGVYFGRELRASGVSSVSGLTVGELGYGNGTFAGWVRREGGRWVGRDVIPELYDRAVAAGFEVVSRDAAFSQLWGRGKLDVMVAFDVVEHLELAAIRSFLIETKEALKPGGRLVLRLPSGDSPFSHAIHSGDITHRTVLGSSAVRQLAGEAGLNVAQIRSPVLPVAGLGLWRAMRRVSVLAAQAVAYGFIRIVLMSNRGAVVSPNMLVVLVKPGC